MCLHHTPDVLWTCVSTICQMYYEHVSPSYTRCTMNMCLHHTPDCTMNMCLHHMPDVPWTWHCVPHHIPDVPWMNICPHHIPLDIPQLCVPITYQMNMYWLTWPVTYYTCHLPMLPDLMCWLVRLHVLTDLTSHVTYLTSCVDLSDFIYLLTWPHMWLTTHVTYLT